MKKRKAFNKLKPVFKAPKLKAIKIPKAKAPKKWKAFKIKY